VKQVNCIITMVVALGLTLANAGVLHAVHMYQHRVQSNDGGGSGPGGSHPSGSHHDPNTCPFCIQFASGNKTVSPHFGTLVNFTPAAVQDVVFCPAFVLPSVFLCSSPARAPPAVCL
jgi:hypothetical protein